MPAIYYVLREGFQPFKSIIVFQRNPSNIYDKYVKIIRNSRAGMSQPDRVELFLLRAVTLRVEDEPQVLTTIAGDSFESLPSIAHRSAIRRGLELNIK